MKKSPALLALAFCLAPVFAAPSAPASSLSSSPARIEIAARRYAFSPNRITVAAGRPVTLVFTSLDVTHGLKIAGLGLNVAIHKGKTTEVTLTPRQAGRYMGRCDHFCGFGHGRMRFEVDVEDVPAR